MSVTAGSLRVQVVRRRRIRGGLLALALFCVAVLLVGPVVGIAWKALGSGFGVVSDTLMQPDVVAAAKLTASITLITVGITTVFGVITSIVLVRHRFPGRRFFNALVDLPLAVSPVTVGLMAVLLFGRGGWFEPFFTSRGISIIFAVPSMVLVTVFICVPFVIREVGPVLEELGTEEEDAARTLGANPIQTFFRVTLPNIRWGLLYGVALSTARALGEIGAVLIVSGQIQGQNETLTLYIFRAFEERQNVQGNVVALLLATVSILLLAAIEIFKRKRSKEMGK